MGKSIPDIVWVLLCAALVLAMQVGLCLLQSGLVRSSDSINVAIKNAVDFCVAAVMFCAFGFALMFASSFSGLVGTSGIIYPVVGHWIRGGLQDGETAISRHR